MRGMFEFSGLPISIHALREEGDLSRPFIPVTVLRISIHALREEGDSAGSFPLSV